MTRNTAQGNDSLESTRRHDVDWLRVLGMMVVFLFHCARFFDTGGWHVKSARTSEAVSFLVLIVTTQWMMPLFFVLSGIAAYHSLAAQNWRHFLGSRFKRLAVPLLFGIFVVIAPYQVYLERVIGASFQALSGASIRITSKAGTGSRKAATSPGWAFTCGTWRSCSSSR
jgi:fucose 4-O-acetylase-like acetyltransferase